MLLGLLLVWLFVGLIGAAIGYPKERGFLGSCSG
jgi:hypothetical protein